ncbi:NYN domain-containing protein [Halostagnicola kamekurae]|uniref:TIGR00288 family protein n=1 Tax=Halostagnicola kamekurae TaxID=619731 RepID=A0A1I6QFX8_9EURY|nr:NYN domain-containing protein [Halostagnicola kamekurae]SFS51235.1 TIGR00288 family protein [Halostagnicola kamekurae]
MSVFDRVRSRLESSSEPAPESANESSPTVGLFVDGPNVLRDEFDVDLDDVRDAALEYGRVGITRLYLDEHATPGLIQAAEARGYEVVVTSGDVDVKLAVDATAFVAGDPVDVLVIASRDTDFKPVLEYAGTAGIRTVALAPGSHGRSDALRNAADDGVTLTE